VCGGNATINPAARQSNKSNKLTRFVHIALLSAFMRNKETHNIAWYTYIHCEQHSLAAHAWNLQLRHDAHLKFCPFPFFLAFFCVAILTRSCVKTLQPLTNSL